MRRRAWARLFVAVPVAFCAAVSAPSSPVGAQKAQVVDPVTRVSGADRIETAVAASRAHFPDGAADAAVVVSAATFPDALAAAPLAAARNAPVLLTAGSDLDRRTGAELRRALPLGSTVFIVGGTAAVAPAVDLQLTADGYRPTRVAGTDRFETAIEAARLAQPEPQQILISDGLAFAEASCAAAAATAVGAGVLVLTSASTMPPSTRSYLDDHPDARRVAVGRTASAAEPRADAVAGPTAVETCVEVAATFFGSATGVGVATAGAFADAAVGAAYLGRRGEPLLLTDPASLPEPVERYLSERKNEIDAAVIYGGEAAVTRDVDFQVGQAISGCNAPPGTACPA